MKVFLIILLLVVVISVKCQVDYYGIEMTERGQISKFRNWHDYVQFDDSLMALAKQEAERLAAIGRLEKPQINTLKNYVGHSKKLTGKIVDAASSK